MKRSVEQHDLLKFHFLSNPSLSPEGGRIAYRVSRPDMEKNGYSSDIWLYDIESDTNRRMTTSGAESFFCWGHDGTSLVFASKRGEKKDIKSVGKQTCFYSIDARGGEAVPLFTIPHAASAIRMLDDHRYLVTAIYEPEYENPEEADLMVFEQLPFMANGKGYIGQQRTALCLYNAKTEELKRLTPPLMDVARYTLNKSGAEVLIVGTEYKDVKPSTNAVYSMDLFTGSMRCLSGGLPCAFAFKHAAWVGDAVVVTGTDQKKMGVNENLKFYVLRGDGLECLTPDLDSSLSNAVTADSHYGCTELDGAFFPRSEGLVYCATDVMKSRLYELDKNGRARQLTFEASVVIDYSARNGRVAFVGYEGLYLNELYLLENGKEKRLTDFNRSLFGELTLSQPIHVSVDNAQGWTLDGWYMKPVDFQEGRKYPTLLNIHGGPKAAFGDLYHHEMQCWAALGYAVIYCNPRGGDGRTNGFEDIRGRYGEADYHDLMVFTDWCVKKLHFIDDTRLGVTGGSYGGYMTNWMITQTHRFKAAVSQRGISNWVSKFGGCDIGYYYVEDQHLGTPWKDMENLWKESPMKYVDKAKTPILFVHSTEDFRCELNQAFQMFTALKVLGVESRMCVFKGENHELSRSGKPRNRLARLREISAWFDTHL